MAENSTIAWTDHTFNPWIGCQKVSAACDNCYAESYDQRWNKGERWGPHAIRTRTAVPYWNQPAKWNRKAAETQARSRVFCASLADVFDNHKSVLAEWREDLWNLIRETPNLDWLLLTKRPQNIQKYLPADWGDGYPNVWLGTTVENQEEADRRIPHLLSVPAALHFLSCEPLLGEVDLSPYIAYNPTYEQNQKSRRKSLHRGGEPRTGDRRPRPGMAGRQTRLGQVESSHPDEQMPSREGRAQVAERLSSSQSDDRRDAAQRDRSSISLATPPRATGGRLGDKPQERDQIGQPPEQSGVGDEITERTARNESSQGRTVRGSMGREELGSEVDRETGQRNSPETFSRGETIGDSGRLRNSVSNSIKDSSQGASPARFWVICGGESGSNYRPGNLDWFRSLRDQCIAAGVPFLFKQHEGKTRKEIDAKGRELDGVVWDQFPECQER